MFYLGTLAASHLNTHTYIRLTKWEGKGRGCFLNLFFLLYFFVRVLSWAGVDGRTCSWENSREERKMGSLRVPGSLYIPFF